MKQGTSDRAVKGNTFLKLSLRAIGSAREAKGRGVRIRCLLEHPEDLGRCRNGWPRNHSIQKHIGGDGKTGVPASIWQFPETRNVFGDFEAFTVAGHQCQYPGYDVKKPTRLWSDIKEVLEFGLAGWPVFDAFDNYQGPLPRDCGHVHRRETTGRHAPGEYNTSSTAAYPPAMCDWIAKIIFEDWLKSLSPASSAAPSASGMGRQGQVQGKRSGISREGSFPERVSSLPYPPCLPTRA